MSAQLTIFAINSLIRLGQTGIKAYEESARNEALLFPALELIDLAPPAFVTNYFNKADNEKYVIHSDSEYAEFWEYQAGGFSRPKRDQRSIDSLMIAITRIEAQRGRTSLTAQSGPAAVLVKTWNTGDAPLSAVARIALVGADIALEYVGTNTGVVGGGNGAKLISAYAKTLSAQLPDDGRLSTKDKVTETLTGMLLRAGFATISAHGEWITTEKHLIALIESTIKPLTETFPLTTDSQIIEFELLTNTLMGPAASALFNAVANNQSVLFGDKYSPEKPFGAITKALFINAKNIGLDNQFTEQGLMSLFKVSLDVVAKKPELFFDNDGEPNEQLAFDLFSGMASVLSEAEYPFNRQVGVDLAKVSLTAVSANASHFVNEGEPWHSTAAELLKSMMQQLVPILGAKGAMKGLFTELQLTEYGRVILTHIAKSPSMLVLSDNKAYSGIIMAMSQAMAADEKLLLKADDWLMLAAVAAQEAATNPMRLFNINPANPQDVLAGDLMKIIFEAATQFAIKQGDKSVLFGQTLTEALAILLKTTSGNLAMATAKIDEIKSMMALLNDFMHSEFQSYGSKEFLGIYRLLLEKVMADIEIPALTQQFVNDLLDGAKQ